ncbi:Hypothetical protein HDN1F_10360 [gamma proteobacterium HdN1]|nr:Hypothetical protein HDN1F_10360 [gamma proteobacterium HdN1]
MTPHIFKRLTNPLRASFLALPLFYAGAGLFSMVAPSIAHAEIAIITHPSASLDAASKEEVARIYLGKSTQIQGTKLTPIDLIEGNKTRDAFYLKTTGKSPAQVNSYWSAQIFSGKGQPPETAVDDIEMVQTISSNSGQIGYVDVSAVNASVKVILTIP